MPLDVVFPFDLPPVLALLLVIVLVILSATRLTRFIVDDTLGHWLIRGPLERWGTYLDAHAAKECYKKISEAEDIGAPLSPRVEIRLRRRLEKWAADEPITIRAKAISGLACPWCVGFWISLILVILSFWLLMLHYWALPLIILMSALSCSYVVGMLLREKS